MADFQPTIPSLLCHCCCIWGNTPGFQWHGTISWMASPTAESQGVFVKWPTDLCFVLCYDYWCCCLCVSPQCATWAFSLAKFPHHNNITYEIFLLSSIIMMSFVQWFLSYALWFSYPALWQSLSFFSLSRPEEVLRTGTPRKGSISGAGSAVTVSPSGGNASCWGTFSVIVNLHLS